MKTVRMDCIDMIDLLQTIEHPSAEALNDKLSSLTREMAEAIANRFNLNASDLTGMHLQCVDFETRDGKPIAKILHGYSGEFADDD